MKIANEPPRVVSTPGVSGLERSSEDKASASTSTAPADQVQISSLASAMSANGAAGNGAKVAALKDALQRGENIVDLGRIADGLIADGLGDA
jgi:flagellar biosynthesis anti-sigma factor FlgM